MKKIFTSKEEKQGILCFIFCLLCACGIVQAIIRELNIAIVLYGIAWLLFLILMLIYLSYASELRKNPGMIV